MFVSKKFNKDQR